MVDILSKLAVSATPLKRHAANPILSADDVPYHATLVFNAGVAKYQGRYVMVFRNDYGRWGDTRFDGTNLGLAFSDDGVNWQVQPRPCITLEQARDLMRPLMPHRDTHEEIYRFYDPRLTVIDGRMHLCFAVDTAHGVCGGVAVTDDFDRFELLSISSPDNRNLVLFPEKIDGHYVRLERPMPVYSRRGRDRFDIWLARSPDLRYWGGQRCVLGVEDLPHANDKIGPGAPPIKTRLGWLTAIHTVNRDESRGKNGWEAKWTKRYDAGLALLDLEDPSRVVAVAPAPLLTPEASYETGHNATPDTDGFRNHVIFPGGMILEDDGEVKIYYGAADTVECLAKAHVDDLLAFCFGAALSD
ncbi:glycoside hydrolase family 130 protein [Phycisphaerales bacterium AB-hyl4]|uniref:Glycoside hydrolase family 130 protein n=1 Tax=Natronomicrosphaera hydrolytica TaxID=3242702 RepID=A0ABV4U1E5_9BACT